MEMGREMDRNGATENATPDTTKPTGFRTLARSRHPADRLVGLALIAALGLLVAGVTLPAIEIGSLWFSERYSVAHAILSLARDGAYVLFVVLMLFSIVFPAVKILICLYVWYAVAPSSARATRLLGLLATVSKWSMLDVFMVALTVVIVDGKVLTSADIHVGIVLFAAAVLLSSLAAWRLGRLAPIR